MCMVSSCANPLTSDGVAPQVLTARSMSGDWVHCTPSELFFSQSRYGGTSSSTGAMFEAVHISRTSARRALGHTRQQRAIDDEALT